jgi:beta-N-acetylglucosaminidase
MKIEGEVMKNSLKYISFIFLFFGLFPLIINASTSYAINDKASVARSCTIKTEPNEGGEFLVKNSIHYLDPGDIVTLVEDSEPVKSTNQKCSSSYYYVIYSGRKGYVCGDFIDFDSDEEDNEILKELRNEGFPESYLPSLLALKKQYPEWEFKAYKTGLKFSDVVESQSIVGKSYIQVSDPNGADSIYLSLDGLSYNVDTKTFNQMEAGGWYAANKATVAYYLDVRNFLNARDIYMFEKSTYNEENQTLDTVKKIFENTDLLEYAEEFIKAADNSGNNISPTMLAVRSKQEVVISNGKLSAAANGSKGYYNFFNLGSLSSCVNPVLCGNDFAAGKGWTTASAAISGGASYIYDNYVAKEQDTLYFQKYNVTKTNTNSHQYMTNITAPKSEANYLYKGYSGAETVNKKTYFVIPIFEDMPESISALPTEINQDDLDNANQSNVEVKDEIKLDVASIINGSGYRYNNSVVSNIAVGTTASSFLTSLKAISKDATVVITSNGKEISGNEILGTGDTIKITSGQNSETVSVVIYGDTNGDGNINILDLLAVQKQILGTINLSGNYKTAADTNKDGSINILDLLAVQKQILGTSKISQ